MRSAAVPPILVEFAAPSRLYREGAAKSSLHIVQNGLPGTRVLFGDGREIPLPTDLIVELGDETGAARVTFGGFRFDGALGELLVFRRVADLLPSEGLSDERGLRMTLPFDSVAALWVGGELAWTRSSAHH